MINHLKYFPYTKIRKEQDSVLQQIAKNWDNKRFFILQLDVGTGKSGIAKTVANWSNNSFIITQTKQLQDQYMHEFSWQKDLLSMKGKANYLCNQNTQLNCENGMCTDMSNEERKALPCYSTCRYYRLRKECMDCHTVVTSYAYIFRAFECAGFWKKRNLCVFDECHAFEDQMVEFASFSLDTDELSRLGIRGGIKLIKFTGSTYNDNIYYIKKICDLVKHQRDFLYTKVQHDIALLKKKNETDDKILELIRTRHWKYYQLDKIYKKIDIFLQNDPVDWIFIVKNDGKALSVKPVEIGNLFYKYAMPIADKFIFMSATILDTEQFRKMLRLPEDDCMTISIGSTFDPEMSPIYAVPCGKMTMRNLSHSLPQVYKTVQNILNEHKSERGIIHTVSYDLANKIVNNVYSKRYTIRQASETNEELVELHSDKKNSVLVSPSMTTGVDLKDDLSRFQIIVKLPWKSLADKRTKIKASKNFNWYACEMLKQLIQACGRSTRSKTDWSETYILDEKFPKWIKKYRSMLPEQFVKRIHFEED